MILLTAGIDWISAISTVGFPIVCCAAMFYLMHETNKSHKEESEKWATALNNNTVAIQKLTDYVERLDEK